MRLALSNFEFFLFLDCAHIKVGAASGDELKIFIRLLNGSTACGYDACARANSTKHCVPRERSCSEFDGTSEFGRQTRKKRSEVAEHRHCGLAKAKCAKGGLQVCLCMCMCRCLRARARAVPAWDRASLQAYVRITHRTQKEENSHTLPVSPGAPTFCAFLSSLLA